MRCGRRAASRRNILAYTATATACLQSLCTWQHRCRPSFSWALRWLLLSLGQNCAACLLRRSRAALPRVRASHQQREDQALQLLLEPGQLRTLRVDCLLLLLHALLKERQPRGLP